MPQTIPPNERFRPVVLRLLSDGEAHRLRDLADQAADELQLSQAERELVVKDGRQTLYQNRTAWACSRLYKAGLVAKPERGVYAITDNGRAVDARNLTFYTDSDMEEWPAWSEYRHEVAQRNPEISQAATDDALSGNLPDTERDPVEAAEDLVSECNAEVETELRRRLQEASPEFFERAVVELLWAMGYGGAHGRKRHVGKSGDGGIDGVIEQDALGLTNIYVQAKRYADTNTVGSPEIRNFIGALDSTGATLGVFITSSRFAPAAQKAAAGYRHGRIVLIDGITLTSLMLSYGVAVQKAKELTLYEVDDDFFADA